MTDESDDSEASDYENFEWREVRKYLNFAFEGYFYSLFSTSNFDPIFLLFSADNLTFDFLLFFVWKLAVHFILVSHFVAVFIL